MSTIVNNCTNIILVTFSDPVNEIYLTRELIKSDIMKQFHLYDEAHDEPDDVTLKEGIITSEYHFESEWTAPLLFLKELHEKYKVNIIGVSYEFTDGYVDSYEFSNLEYSEQGFEILIDSKIQEGIDTIIIPENDLNILNSIEEDTDFSDSEITDLKEKKLKDWQSELLLERWEVDNRITILNKQLKDNPNIKDSDLINMQIDAMIDYRFSLDERIKRF